jgi:hypothetical protein
MYDFSLIVIRHNGSKRDLVIRLPYSTKGKYVISFKVLSGNIQTVGGLQITNIQLERGEEFHDYEPYTSTTHTTTFPSAIYRGSEDVVKGEVSGTWLKLVFDGSNDENWNYGGTPPFLYIDVSNGIIVDNTTQYNKDYVISNMYKTSSWVDKEDSSVFMFYNASRICVKDSTFGSDISAFRTFLTNNPLEIAYFIPNPTTSPVTPTNLPIKSLNGYTHIESSTGDMEIEYITEEFQPIVEIIESNSGKHVYSTQEQVVGKWIDGSVVYEKTYDIGYLTSNNKTIAHGISGFGHIIQLQGYVTNNTYDFPLPYATTDSASCIGVTVNRTNINIYSSNRSDYYGYLTIRYTKI